ncbi:MAG: winged helix-turn-helix transcriptional regulator, partial [Bdellovibrionales bacterium]|nr:winged helix-turn-helix transcriptional regulator [Bdellovibrionales bacterium]
MAAANSLMINRYIDDYRYMLQNGYMELLETYRSLADESRLRLLAVLNRGQFNVGELTTILQLSQSTISHHLKILQQVGLVKSKREGTWSYYGLNFEESSAPSQLVLKNFLE